jgi:hypothetical protein
VLSATANIHTQFSCPSLQCVIGSTGPLLAFTTVVFNLSKSLDVPFLPFNAWVSIWLFIYIALASFFDLTRFVRLATRFTDDVFAFLIVCIFVMDAVGDPFSQVGLLRYFDPDHKSHREFEDDPDYDYMEVALLSLILGLGTTSLTFFFRSFQNSTFFCNDGFRGSIHDFAVSMSVLIWAMIKIFAFPDIETEKLNVPGSIEPSLRCCDDTCNTSWPLDCPDQAESFGTRSWIVNLGDVGGKSWVPFVAAGPAALAFVLIFLDNGITWHLIYHKSHKLEHGESYNYDLLLSGVFNVVNGMLGLPWLVATTVPCLIHLNGLATKDSTGKFLSVQETRLTGLFAHLLMGMSLLVLSALKLIPVPVLYGVFLFMGLASLAGIQFWNRVLSLLRQPSLYPNTVYNKYIDKARVHKYTGMQFIFFCGVFVVIHMKAIAIVFPLFTLLCIPARLFLFPKMFAGWELLLLDGEDEDIAEWVEAKENAINNTKIDDSDLEELPAKTASLEPEEF